MVFGEAGWRLAAAPPSQGVSVEADTESEVESDFEEEDDSDFE